MIVFHRARYRARRTTKTVLAVAASAAALILFGEGLSAQQRDSIPGVRLGLLYETGVFQPPIAFMPFEGRAGGEAVAGQVEAIVARDLRYSDRYRVMDSIPPVLRGETIDYTLWDRLGAVWLLTGRVEGSGGGFELVLELHDVVYAQVKQQGRFPVPAANSPDFRMAVHRASDEVVRWTFGEPGMAASRIAFAMLQNGSKELYIVDADGENLRRLTSHGDVVVTPAWSPDGQRIAYSSPHDTGAWEIYELDLATRRSRKLTGLGLGAYAPAYHPDGGVIAFSVAPPVTSSGSAAGGTSIYTYDLARECCRSRLTNGTRDDLSPTFSPDGRYIAFNSNRFGDAVPQIFYMPVGGGDVELISPHDLAAQGYYTSPDWSPFGNLVAFHGRVGRYGPYNILVARMGERGRLTQLTWEGQNEDPSWAPDGRHLVFKGERQWGKGLFVVDTVTGTIRAILSGVDITVPQWSPPMGVAADSGAGSR
jgi:TolB protein